ESAPKSASSTGAAVPVQIEPLFVVVDTNCLLEHFSELFGLKKSDCVTLIIPMAVIHELDGLKKDNGNVGFKARVVIRSVLDALQENQGLAKKWIRGQNSFEIIE